MTGIAVYCRTDAEKKHIHSAAAELALHCDWADSSLVFCESPARLCPEQGAPIPDIVLCDITADGASEALRAFRRLAPEAAVIPIADAAVSPKEYVRPDIMPCSLLWKPFDRAAAAEALTAAFQYRRAQTAQETPERRFELKSKTGTQRIAYSSILYFEAREKKLCLRLPGRELCFPGTLSGIEAGLPESFVRCHKSFIVNCAHILAVRHDLQCIELDEQLSIPYSRGYRKPFMERFYGRNS